MTRGLAILLLLGLAPMPAQADVCLAPERLGDFLAQSSFAAFEQFQSRLAANPEAGGCTQTETDFCPAPAGLFAVWSNNAAAYWFGPLATDDDPRRINRRLADFSRTLGGIVERGDYRSAGHHFILTRTAECFQKSSQRGVVSPQLLFDIGREKLTIEATAARLDLLTRGLADAVREGGSAASEEARARLESNAGQLAGEAWRTGVATLEGGETPRPLGRIGDGLLHLVLYDGRAGGSELLDSAFTRWLAGLLSIAAGEPDALRDRLALLVWMAHPEPFDLLYESEGGATDGDAFDTIAAVYGARDAKLGLAQAVAEGGPVARALGDLNLFRSSLPDGVAARLVAMPASALFTLSGEGGSAPDPAALRPLLTGSATRESVEADTAAEARRLGRIGLAAAAADYAGDLGVALDGDRLAGQILAADHAAMASDMLRATLSRAFVVEGGGSSYVEALAQGDYQAFAALLLGAALEAGLAGHQDSQTIAADMARALLAGDPVATYQGLALAAAKNLDAAWRRPLGLLVDGRSGDAVRAALQLGLEAEGVETPLAVRLLETGDARPLLDGALARKLGLPLAEIARLAAGSAPEHVRRRAAEMVAVPAQQQAMFEALAVDPAATLDRFRRQLETDLLASLAPAEAARPARLSELADPLARRPVAAALLARAVERAPLAAMVFPAPALAALVAGQRDGALEPALGPLLVGVPGAAELLAGNTQPYRAAVSEALRSATAAAAGEETAERLFAGSMLDALEEGDLQRLGRSYAERLLAASSLAPQSARLLLAGRIDDAWRHEASVRLRAPSVDRQFARIARILWRARAAHDLTRFAHERLLRVHGLDSDGLPLRDGG